MKKQFYHSRFYLRYPLDSASRYQEALYPIRQANRYKAVVTDGYNFTQTNERGEYSLDSNLIKSRFVHLSVSGDYEIEQTKGISSIFSISNLIKVRRSMNMILRSPLGNSQSTGLSTWQSPILRPSTNGR